MIMAQSQPMSQAVAPLVEGLQLECVAKLHTPFYTPGHKRGKGAPQSLIDLLGMGVFQADLPELPRLGNLQAPVGAIADAQSLAAEAFGAEKTWFLVNGSTCGVVAAILATCQPGDRILLPRNMHQSAISGLILSGAIPVFIPPEYDPVLDLVHSISPQSVAEALAEYPDAKAVLMVSPTYYGVCGDVETIAQIAHHHGIPLLVDEAHAPHFAFHPDLPTPALAAGADLVVQSTHKVLSALSQAAMLHLQGSYIKPDRVSQVLQLLQSTSPSYLLLASLDAARQQMALQGKALMSQTLQLADAARLQIQQIPDLSVLHPQQAGSPGFVALDRTRLTVTVAGLGLTGFAADEILQQQWEITAELPSPRHLTFIISLGNTWDDIDRLVQSLMSLPRSTQPGITALPLLAGSPIYALTPREAFFAAAESVPIAQAADRVCVELICPYPPGIPVLLPGEMITPDALDYLQQVLSAGGFVSGCSDSSLQTIKVVRQ